MARIRMHNRNLCSGSLSEKTMKEFALLNEKRKGKVVQLNPMRKWTIAASIAIILGLIFAYIAGSYWGIHKTANS